MAVGVNPLEGQVAIPYERADSGYVVGCLSSRAQAWVEAAGCPPVPDIWVDVLRRTAEYERLPEGQVPSMASSLPLTTTATVLWAGIEGHRRRAHLPGPEYTIDDAYDIIDAVGIDQASGYVVALISLSLPFKAQREEIERQAAEVGVPDPFAQIREAATTAATGGTGAATSTLPPPSG